MKVLLLSITLATIAFSSSVFAGNGWSSSGGGEYIIDKNNPWFMGNMPVKYCIDYGGSETFSLSLDEAKKEIDIAIVQLTSQLKSINNNTSKVYYEDPIEHEGGFFKKCGLVQNSRDGWECSNYDEDQRIQLSDKFVYIDDCSRADLEFILGNYNNPKITSLIKEIGLEKFKKIAGTAIRTSYSTKSLRATGFIYIAADKGEIQYSGARNLNFKNNTIWNTYSKLPEGVAFPQWIESRSADKEIHYKYKLKLKDYSMGNLSPVVAHELGHVFGFGHNHSQRNIMDEDYPARIVRQGIEFKGNFKRESLIFSRGLIESEIEHRIGFEWAFNKIDSSREIKLSKDFPAIYKFLYDLPKDYLPKNYKWDTHNLIFVFDIDSFSQKKHHIQTVTFEKDQLKYKTHKSYEIELSTCPLPTIIEPINFRTEQLSGDKQFTMGEGNKLEDNFETSASAQTYELLSIGNTYFCGKIFLNGFKNKVLGFKLSHNYFYSNSLLELIDPSNPTLFTLILNDSDIFQFSNSNQDLPLPMPAFDLL